MPSLKRTKAIKRGRSFGSKSSAGMVTAKKPTRTASFSGRLGASLITGSVPPLAKTQLIYSTGGTYRVSNCPGAATTTWSFCGNSLYDPDAQVGGQQPSGFDQWSTLYRHYRVIGAKCTVTIGLPNYTHAALNIRGAEAVTWSDQSMLAQPMSQWISARSNAVVENKRLSIYANSSAITGFDRDDDTLSAQVTASPAAQWFFDVTVYNKDAGNSYNADFIVNIIYFVEFFHPQNQGMS